MLPNHSLGENNLTVGLCMCLCALKELTANYTEREREWDLVPWNQTRDVCTQWPMLPATEVSDVPASGAGTNGVFYAQALQ